MELTIARKLFSAIAVALVLIFILGISGIWQTNSAHKSGDMILMETENLNAVQELRVSFQKVLMPANDYLIHGEREERVNFEVLDKILNGNLDTVVRLLSDHRHPTPFKDQKEVIAGIEKDIEAVESLSIGILNIENPVGNAEGALLMEKMDLVADRGVEKLDALLKHFQKDAQNAKIASAKAKDRAAKTTGAVGFLIITGMIGGGLFFVRRITGPIMELLNATRRVSSGDFTARAKIVSNDEIGALAVSFNGMAENVNRLMEKERFKTIELEKAYQKLESAQTRIIQSEILSSVGRIAAGIVHELKNPLGVIQQGIEYISRMVEAKKEGLADVLAAMRRSVKKADHIVRGLLDLSRVRDFVAKETNINSVLEDALSAACKAHKCDDIEISRNFKKDIPMVLADETKLEGAFINLISNAVQAMPKGGKLLLKSSLKEISPEDSLMAAKKGVRFTAGDEVISVEIEDTGAGIAKENLERIFEPFFTTKKYGEGTGLGLAIVNSVIQLHKGVIKVESEENKGTKVTVFLKAT